MPKDYTTLPTVELKPNTSFIHPEELPELVRLDSPAHDTMLDLKNEKSITISRSSTISDASIEMKMNNHHLLLVTDEQDSIVGIISSEHIFGERTMKFIVERKIPRDEVLVNHVMLKLSEILTLNSEDLRHAKVGNIVKTLQYNKHHDGLVVSIDEESGEQTVCGIFSLSDISRQLGEDVTASRIRADSIAELRKGF